MTRKILREVILGPHHLRPGRTRHTVSDGAGVRDFPFFVRLEIVQYSGESGFYLLHISEDGQIADTWHESLADAFQQAKFEFEVEEKEWASRE